MYEVHRSSGLRGVAKVVIQIDESGYIISSGFLKGTGHPELDETAMSIIHMGEPYPHVAQRLAIEIKLAPEN